MAQIWYTHHPFFGQTVEIVRWWRRQTAESLVVKLPEGVQIAIAAWRLDPLACRQLQDTATARVSVDALLALQEVLDHSGLLRRPARATSEASLQKGACDAPELS